MDDRYWLMIGTGAGTVIGTTIGGAVSILSSILTHRGTLKREQEAKRVEWGRQRIESERKSLRELQEALREAIQAAIPASLACVTRANKLPFIEEMGRAEDGSDQASTDFGVALYKAEILRSWAEDEEVRVLSGDLLDIAIKLAHAKTPEESLRLGSEAGILYKRAVGRIGDTARGLTKR